ncbi:MAG: hypothetical protein ACLVML_09075 [Candidatus Gastranaerophilaceae bacterium]|nr:hypothetical protein [Christensenellales bacterium]
MIETIKTALDPLGYNVAVGDVDGPSSAERVVITDIWHEYPNEADNEPLTEAACADIWFCLYGDYRERIKSAEAALIKAGLIIEDSRFTGRDKETRLYMYTIMVMDKHIYNKEGL